jgi:hypothetical protein
MNQPRHPFEEGGVQGIIADPATLASTGLLIAVLFAVVAGIIGFFTDANVITSGFRGRMLNLTDTVDVGDVALLGIAVALLLLTPDPPGGVRRDLLMQVDCVLAAIITVYGVIRALVLISVSGSSALRLSGFISTVGVAIAAATIAFWAARESFMKQAGAGT